MTKPKRTNSRLFRAPNTAPRDRMAKKAADVEEWLDALYRSRLESNRQREDLGRQGGGGGENWD